MKSVRTSLVLEPAVRTTGALLHVVMFYFWTEAAYSEVPRTNDTLASVHKPSHVVSPCQRGCEGWYA
jgi:hypothetical protein